MSTNNNMLAGVSAIFIDIDDTLWWFTENSKVAFRHIYDTHRLQDIEPDYDRFHNLYLQVNNRLWEQYHHGEIEKDFLVNERFGRVLQTVGYKGDCAQLASLLNRDYLAHLATLPLAVPGAEELLKRLTGRGFQVNVLSNGFKGVQQQKLRSAGLLHYITHVVLSDDCGITKPQRGIFDYALQVTGATAESAVMIGDNPEADIQGAHEAGWKTIYFNLKGKVAIPGTADHEVASLEEIS